MKPANHAFCLAALLLAVAVNLPVSAQDAKKDAKPGGAPDEAAMMEQMMALAQPGENHKIFEHLSGSWTYAAKSWMAPNQPAMEFSGNTSTKSAMGGRYCISDHSGKMQFPGPDGKMMNMDFNGMAIEGYDNVKKKYVSSWIDNMGTGIVMSEGTYDAATKTLTYIGEYEPLPGMKTKSRQVVKYTDHDHHTMTFFETRGPTEVKVMEITYTRAGK